MERCVWSLQIIEGLIVLNCNFSTAPFSTGRKMQVICEASGALSSVLLSKDLPCYIGIGPTTSEVQNALWQIALIPDMEDLPTPVLEARMGSLLQEAEAFCLHLNRNPRSHLLDPNPTSSTILN